MNPKKEYSIVAFLLLLFFTLAVTSMTQKSVTYDEIVHAAAGYLYLRTGEFYLNPEHPPLVKEISAIPLLFLGANLDTQALSLQVSKRDIVLGDAQFGTDFFYVQNNNVDNLIFWSRLMMVLLGIIFGIYVYVFAKELYGPIAGIFALFVYSFSPEIVAHTQLVTTDLPLAGFVLISTYHFRRFLKNQSNVNLAIAGITLGLVLATKYTAIFMIPIVIVFALLYLYFQQPSKIPSPQEIKAIFTRLETKNLSKQLGFIIAIAFVTLYATYFFFDFTTYIRGLQKVVGHSNLGHETYIFGEHSTEGVWYYFPVAFLVKTSIPTIALLLLAIVLTWKLSPQWKDELYLIIPAIVFFVIFLPSKINIGHRHILTIYPFLYIFASKVVNYKKTLTLIFITLLSLWLVWGTATIHPHYLAYFNEFAGGPANGHKILIDSNIDWGQDLKGLKPYLEERGIDHINLGFFGRDQPEYRNISYSNLTCYPKKGIAVASINLIQGITENEARCLSWLKQYEAIGNVGYTLYIYNVSSPIDFKSQLEVIEEFRTKAQLTTIEIGYYGVNVSFYTETLRPLACKPISGVHLFNINLIEEPTNEQKECFAWIREYDPQKKIGDSIFVYNITLSSDVEKCAEQCKKQCVSHEQVYQESSFVIKNQTKKCGCVCSPQ